MNFLQTTVYEIPLLNWLIALGVLAFSWMFLHILRNILLRRLERFQRASSDFDQFLIEEVRSVRWYFILALSISMATAVLNPPAATRELVRLVTVTALLLQLAISGQALISYMINRRMRIRMETDPAAATTLSAFNLIARIGLWVIILLMVLDNLPGIQITSLIASLGITGVAVALAVQSILGDLFASLSIAMDKPFVIGDQIVIDNYTGTVEHIGLKSTRVRSLEGEQIIFANSDLLSSRIRNYKRMVRRRVPFTIRVRHGTSPEKLSKIPGMLRDIISVQEQVTFDRAHFREIHSEALIFEVVYYMETADYMQYMNVHQNINMEIARRFAAQDIQFAFPTQSVIIENTNSAWTSE